SRAVAGGLPLPRYLFAPARRRLRRGRPRDGVPVPESLAAGRRPAPSLGDARRAPGRDPGQHRGKGDWPARGAPADLVRVPQPAEEEDEVADGPDGGLCAPALPRLP